MMLRLQHAGGAVRTVEWLHSDLVRRVFQIYWPLAGSYELTAEGMFVVNEHKLTPQQERNLSQWHVHPDDMAIVREVFPPIVSL